MLVYIGNSQGLDCLTDSHFISKKHTAMMLDSEIEWFLLEVKKFGIKGKRLGIDICLNWVILETDIRVRFQVCYIYLLDVFFQQLFRPENEFLNRIDLDDFVLFLQFVVHFKKYVLSSGEYGLIRFSIYLPTLILTVPGSLTDFSDAMFQFVYTISEGDFDSDLRLVDKEKVDLNLFTFRCVFVCTLIKNRFTSFP